MSGEYDIFLVMGDALSPLLPDKILGSIH